MPSSPDAVSAAERLCAAAVAAPVLVASVRAALAALGRVRGTGETGHTFVAGTVALAAGAGALAVLLWLVPGGPIGGRPDVAGRWAYYGPLAAAAAARHAARISRVEQALADVTRPEA